MSEVIDEVGPVRAAHRLAETTLAEYLSPRLERFEGPLRIQQFKGGQSNPTYLLHTPTERFVLRKKPPGELLPSAHAVEREYRVLRALGQNGIAVPGVHLLCEDESIIGTPFYVMSCVEGRIFRRPEMPEVESPQERAAICQALIETLADIHRLQPSDIGLGDYGRPGNYMERQVRRWSKQYAASKTEEITAMDKLGAWLLEHVPNDESPRIVHGDFRLENAIIDPVRPVPLAILDWELSTLGHPLADLGYYCMLYHLPRTDHSGSGYLGLDIDALGIPSQDELTELYAKRSGRADVERIDYFVAFGLFRIAAIVQGVYRRGLDGNASSSDALMYGPYVRMLAEAGLRIAGP